MSTSTTTSYQTSILTGQATAFGLSLPFTTQNIIGNDSWEHQCGVADLLSVAKHAEKAGFHYLSTPDHIMVPRDLEPIVGSIWMDTVATLGFLAGQTESIRLLSHVYVPAYRHPLSTAKAFATLDHLSGGRIILGVGTGHFVDEFNTLQVDYSLRGQLTDEAIDVIRVAFQDEYPNIKTEHWDIHDHAIAPRPVQSHLPIWVGGGATPALRRAAQRGDGWLPMLPSFEQWQQQVSALKVLRQEYHPGKAFDIGAWQSVFIGENWGFEDDTLCGGVSEVTDGLRAYADGGANHIHYRIRSRSLAELLEQMDCLSEEIMPQINN